MEIVSGVIRDVKPDGMLVWIPYTNVERACLRQYNAVQVGLPDGRTITPEQRRKAYALMGEIADWSGNGTDEVKLTMKHDFVERHLEGLRKELFSLSDCDVTTAREFISYLIDFVLTWDVPVRVPLVELCDDVKRYVYICLMHKRCAVCGKKADLHHCEGSKVGMGRNRKEICHIGCMALPLCREHHKEAHDHGDAALLAKYHLEAVEIDERIAKAHRLKTDDDKRGPEG